MGGFVKSRRVGKFFLGIEAINDSPKAVQALMAQVIVIDTK